MPSDACADQVVDGQLEMGAELAIDVIRFHSALNAASGFNRDARRAGT